MKSSLSTSSFVGKGPALRSRWIIEIDIDRWLIRRADPSKGISAVGRSRPVGYFPKAPFDLSSATKTDTKKGTRLGEEERKIVNGFIHR